MGTPFLGCILIIGSLCVIFLGSILIKSIDLFDTCEFIKCVLTRTYRLAASMRRQIIYRMKFFFENYLDCDVK